MGKFGSLRKFSAHFGAVAIIYDNVNTVIRAGF